MHSDRRVHASSDEWEMVRYNRAGKWYLESKIPGAPPDLPIQFATTHVGRTGRAAVTIRKAVDLTIGLELTPHFGRLGGSTFDREVRKIATDA